MGARGRPAKTVNRKQGGTASLNAATFPRSVSWRVDQDYLGQLSQTEKAWLGQFNDAYYGADFRGIEQEWSQDERREVYRDKNRANRDLMTCAVPSEEAVPPPSPVELEDAVLDDDAYLDDPEYKQAREAYRAEPSPDRRVRLNQTRKRHRR